jgi:16S rRNA (guanine1516-N2)-methyltransferase
MKTTNLVLLARSDGERQAEAISNELGINLVSKPEHITTERYLEFSDRGLTLVKIQTEGGATPQFVNCDFVTGALRHRRLFGGGIRQPLGRAVGLSSSFKPLVADLTAGLGRDGFVLASLGAQVVLVERNKVVAALLSDGLKRLREIVARESIQGRLENHSQNLPLKSISHRLTMQAVDGKDWLQSLSGEDRPDVIYLDPMFPQRSKSAKVKKEMAIFRDLVGNDDDAGELLALALQVARYRVVVKRPRRALPLAGVKPGFSIEGKTTRFDIYPLKKIPR